MKVKRLIGVAALTMGLFGVLGCGSSTTEVQNPEQLTFANFRDIRDLNPHLYAGEMYAQEMLYDTLVQITDTGYGPALAESWDISVDGLTYTFHIRPNMKFSDGEVLDANSIKANFDAILDNRSRHTWLESLDLITSYEAIDANTFVIKLSKPYYPLLIELSVTRPFAMISPKSMKNGTTKDGVTSYVGSGPYKLTEVVTDKYAVFEANENYWGEQPKTKKIVVKVIPDNQTRILALEKGEIDLIYGKNMVDPDAMRKFKDLKGFTADVSKPTSTRQIVINTTKPGLNDKAVRYALQYATNKQKISEGIFYGLEPAADTLFATSVPYANVGLKPYEYSEEKAKSTLSEAGYVLGTDGIYTKDGNPLEFNLLYNADSVTEKNIAEFLQAEYKKVGIKLTIKGEEEQSYRDNMKAGNFDLVFNISWGTPYDPQSSLSGMRRPVYGDYAAQQGLADKAEIDNAITEILTSTDETRRQELYKFVLTHLHEDAVYIPITYETNKAVYNNRVKGVHFMPTQYEVPFASMSLEK
ncbi:MAG: nickel ABC transporter substrate-binding protein [Veillonella caviae]|uniref:nickel ABC transporter substrate-binding protein n=1 Tax=Veillonella caviae TaxID=248316 RepID=UPI002A917ECE|nr:nickel ABC transporter substrate-binding protein [Veillonella caviae]MDY5481945.1 nickel ABC transporter substrate-binding protein [Veillonella caviae]